MLTLTLSRASLSFDLAFSGYLVARMLFGSILLALSLPLEFDFTRFFALALTITLSIKSPGPRRRQRPKRHLIWGTNWAAARECFRAFGLLYSC
jgi:hypothetical protein